MPVGGSPMIAKFPSLGLTLLSHPRKLYSDSFVRSYVGVVRSTTGQLERDWPFRIVNILELVGESMGLHRDDRYKQLKIMQDADLIIAECNDLIAHHRLDIEAARDVVVKAMLNDQPLPSKGGVVAQA